MIVQSIELIKFRNYQSERVVLQPGSTLIHGNNGQGKTNLLEAVFLLLQGYSFRTKKILDCLPWDSKEAILRLEANKGGTPLSIGIRLQKNGGKEVSINGQRHKKMSVLLGLWPVVAIGPGDIELSQGAPAVRRRFLDSSICQFDLEYLEALRKYQHVLKQRNQLLKDFHSSKEATWTVYTEQLAQLGAILIAKRKAWVAEIEPIVARFYGEIAQGKEAISLSYGDKWEGEQVDFQNQLIAGMQVKKIPELTLGTTLSGPHKDDLSISLNQQSLREFGSQGQQRSTALALKLAFADWSKSKLKKEPLILLDDVFAELDPGRKSALVKYALSFPQVFLTTPLQESEGIPTDHHLKIEAGKVTF